MNLLQEKMPAGVNKFNLNGPRSDIDYSQFYVVLEFECYVRNDFDLDEYMAENDPGENEDRKLIEPDADDEDWLDYIEDHFYPYGETDKIKRDAALWKKDQLETYAEQYQKDHPENKDIFPIILRKMENLYGAELTPHEYLVQSFSSLRAAAKFYHLYPQGGWADDVDGDSDNESAFYTEEENERFDPDSDELTKEALRSVLNHPFFSDKKATIEVPRYKKPDTWYIETDGSLEFDYSSPEIGIEIVTPWIRGDEIDEVIESFKTEFFEDMDGRTSRRTGGHVNIRLVRDLEINWVKLMLLTQDYIDLRKFERHDNRYATPVYPELQRILLDRRFSTKLNREHLNYFADTIKKKFSPQKFQSINVVKFLNDVDANGERTNRQGFVEFRIPGNDYFGSYYRQYKRSIYRFMNLMAATSDSSLFEDEYYVRLTRLYRQVTETNLENKTSPGSYNYENFVYHLANGNSISTLSKELFHTIRYLKKTSIDLETRDAEIHLIIPVIFKSKNMYDTYNNLFHANHMMNWNVWLSAILYKIANLNSLIVKQQNTDMQIELIARIIEKNNMPGYHKIDLSKTFYKFQEHFPEDRFRIPSEIIDMLVDSKTESP